MKKQYFYIALSVYFILLLSKKMELFFPELINSYLSDLLCIPIVMSICLYVIQWMKNDRYIQFSLFQIIAVTLAFSFVFEWYMPMQYATIYTRDVFDVLCYFVGALFYYWAQLKEYRTSLI